MSKAMICTALCTIHCLHYASVSVILLLNCHVIYYTPVHLEWILLQCLIFALVNKYRMVLDITKAVLYIFVSYTIFIVVPFKPLVQFRHADGISVLGFYIWGWS